MAEVHHEVLHAAIGMVGERGQQLFGVLIGLWKRVLERGRDLDVSRIPPSLNGRSVHDTEPPVPVVVGSPRRPVPEIGQPADEGQADLLARRSDAHARYRAGQRWGRRSGDGEVVAGERRFVLGPHKAADLDGFFELRKADRRRREVVAVRLVFTLAPTGTDTEDEPTARQNLQRGRHLRSQRGRAIADAQNVVAKIDVGVPGS